MTNVTELMPPKKDEEAELECIANKMMAYDVRKTTYTWVALSDIIRKFVMGPIVLASSEGKYQVEISASLFGKDHASQDNLLNRVEVFLKDCGYHAFIEREEIANPATSTDWDNAPLKALVISWRGPYFDEE